VWRIGTVLLHALRGCSAPSPLLLPLLASRCPQALLLGGARGWGEKGCPLPVDLRQKTETSAWAVTGRAQRASTCVGFRDGSRPAGLDLRE
jgi:hypothetical protein